jgi:uncharacterized Zn finger protein (UPF0148 family)
MEKYGVVQESNADSACRRCGAALTRHGAVVLCPRCGSEAYEEEVTNEQARRS